MKCQGSVTCLPGQQASEAAAEAEAARVAAEAKKLARKLAQLRSELAPLTARALLKRAKEAGVDEGQIEAADEADDRKGALTDLIVAAAEAQARAAAELRAKQEADADSSDWTAAIQRQSQHPRHVSFGMTRLWWRGSNSRRLWCRCVSAGS
jgi:hypothetical protein